ncbi:MAG: thioesterase family protein [Planctomycetota bacterium]
MSTRERMADRPSSNPEPAADPFAHRIRVRYAECDQMQVAHHGGFAVWLEEARTEMLRATGVSYEAVERAGVFLVITLLEVRYRRPVRYDDVIEVRVTVKGKGRARLRHEYEIKLVERRGAEPDHADPAVPPDGVLATAVTELACVNTAGRPSPIPEALRPFALAEADALNENEPASENGPASKNEAVNISVDAR